MSRSFSYPFHSPVTIPFSSALLNMAEGQSAEKMFVGKVSGKSTDRTALRRSPTHSAPE